MWKKNFFFFFWCGGNGTNIQSMAKKHPSLTATTTKSLQLCPTLCDPIDSSPQDSPVPGILQAKILEWVVISFSNAWKWKVKVKSLSRVRLLATPWTAAYQAPPSIGFARQEYWSGCHCLLPEEMQWKLNKITWRWPSSGLVYHRCSIGKISSSSFSVYETSETQLS